MSVRAYKIITKELADNPSFNLWHDQELMDALEDTSRELDCSMTQNIGEDGGGTISIPVEAIKKVLETFEWEKEGGEDYRQVQLAEDIKGMADDEFVEYECF